jgi:phospholipase C
MRTLLMGGGAAAAAAAAIVLASAHAEPAPLPRATTPIEHVVVIYDENESFDHYFGTYPNAANPAGEPAFTAAAGTPAVDGLSGSLLTANPNGVDPDRIDRANALTCDMNHNYGPEQQAFDGGLMDKFPQFTASGSCTGARGANLVMDYFDGNTVTALWNYAQHFAMSDNSFGSGFGPSTPGAIELVSGQTHGLTDPAAGENGTMIADPNPIDEDCGSGPAKLTGQNVGDLMNAAHVTWGWFQGGFKPTSSAGGTAHCDTAHNNIGGASVVDYSAHHEPFQYYDTTANPHHLPPTSAATIGQTDAANHQYDLSDFDAALAAHNLPQVSYLKAASFEDAHPGYSDPLDEQRFLVRTINAIEQSEFWSSTAIFIAYDDSDGWYDHKFAGIRNPSAGASDAFTSAGHCGAGAPLGGYQDRCGFGPRLPLLLISPYAKVNAVDHTLTEQASILKFIEDNWSLGRIGDSSFDAGAGSLDGLFDFGNGGSTAKLILDASTGNTPTTTPPPSPTATPTPTPTPTPVKPKPFKLKCSATGKGRKLTVSCSGSGDRATTLATKLKLTVTRSGKTIVKASTKLTKGRLKVVLKSKKTLRKGKYTLKLAITRAGKTTDSRLTFTVK